MRWSEIRWALVAIFGLCVWRAVTNSITTDEAFTYSDFVAPSWLQVLTTYDANHHVLHSLLAKLAGKTALRAPALLGTALYLWSAWRVARQRLGETPAMAAAAVLMAVHAGVIDYLSLARGYSLGLGFLFYGLAESEEGRYERASLGLGLAVASNPVFAVPAAAWTVALVVTKRRWRRLDEVIGPGLVAALVVLAVPLSRAAGGQFYYGAGTMAGSWTSLMEVPGLTAVLVYGVPLALAWGGWKERGVLSLTLGLSLVALAGLHLALGFPWPLARTGVYLIPLMVLLAARGGRWSWAPVGVVAAVSLATLEPGVFRPWRFDADNRAVAAALGPRGPVAAQFPLRRGLAFYRPGVYVDWKPGVKAAAYVLRTDEPGPRPEGARLERRFPRSGVEIWISAPQK